MMADEYEDRHSWIIDPIGHRQAWIDEVEGTDGTERDTPFGKAVVIVEPPPPLEEWVCDFDNEPIPIRRPDGVLAFVPMLNSYALCPGCYEKYGGDDKWLEGGMWVCGCGPCQKRWEEIKQKGD